MGSISCSSVCGTFSLQRNTAHAACYRHPAHGFTRFILCASRRAGYCGQYPVTLGKTLATSCSSRVRAPNQKLREALLMRTNLSALLAVVAIAVPAAATHAQSPQRGISKGNIIFNYTGEVLPGQEEALKQLVPKLIAAFQQEPAQWPMNGAFAPMGRASIPRRVSRIPMPTRRSELFANYWRRSREDHEGPTAGRFWQSGCGGEKGDRGLPSRLPDPGRGLHALAAYLGIRLGAGQPYDQLVAGFDGN